MPNRYLETQLFLMDRLHAFVSLFFSFPVNKLRSLLGRKFVSRLLKSDEIRGSFAGFADVSSSAEKEQEPTEILVHLDELMYLSLGFTQTSFKHSRRRFENNTLPAAIRKF